jgi:hypothetical protein
LRRSSGSYNVGIVLLPAFAVLAGLVAAQAPPVPDRTMEPWVAHAAGSFTARRIAEPEIDGREWIAAEVHTDPSPAALRAPDGAFWLTLVPVDRDTGDFVRYDLMFESRERRPVRIAESTGWVYVTPDSRYVISEPLFVLDVAAWTTYALHARLEIPNYTWIQAASADRKRLLVARADCAMDGRTCGDRRIEYYELALP